MSSISLPYFAATSCWKQPTTTPHTHTPEASSARFAAKGISQSGFPSKITGFFGTEIGRGSTGGAAKTHPRTRGKRGSPLRRLRAPTPPHTGGSPKAGAAPRRVAAARRRGLPVGGSPRPSASPAGVRGKLLGRGMRGRAAARAGHGATRPRRPLALPLGALPVRAHASGIPPAASSSSSPSSSSLSSSSLSAAFRHFFSHRIQSGCEVSAPPGGV